MLWRGFYPARWIVKGEKLEIIGQKGSNKEWVKAEYMVKPSANP